MSTIRPGLGAKTGHAAFITDAGLNDTQTAQTQQIAETAASTESNKVRDEYQENHSRFLRIQAFFRAHSP